jgi:hypothetical protein
MSGVRSYSQKARIDEPWSAQIASLQRQLDELDKHVGRLAQILQAHLEASRKERRPWRQW